MSRVTVEVDPPYDVVVAAGALAGLESLVGDRRRVAVVTQRPLVDLLTPALSSFARARGDIWFVLMDDGEDAKTLATVDSLCRSFADGGLLRGDVVVALGGGVVGDTAGLASAVYHRGVAVVQAPTTLLAQVDAAIGGKTAVNLPEGKNLVGAFHQPIGVLADTTTLGTLPDRELRSGLGEIAKYALMPEGSKVADALDTARTGVLARDPEALATIVGACAAIKARIVALDPEERTGIRAMLNYGHTFAHALETTSGHTLAHGECVAIGLVFAANLAHALERIGPDAVDRVDRVLRDLELPTRVPGEAPNADALLDVMRRDKKAKGGLTFILPGRNGLEPVDDPPAAAIQRGFAAVGVGT